MGFQNQEDEALLEEGGNASVRNWYTRTCNVSARNIPRKLMLDLPSSLHIRCRVNYEANQRYQSLLFELPLKMKVQKVGFKNQEDGALLEEGGNASVRYWYTRTGPSKFAPYSMPNKLRSIVNVIKVRFLNYL